MSGLTRRLLFAIGASGAGKTAAVRALSERWIPGLTCYHFDSIGVPSVEEMVRDFGSPERWQEVTTHEWITRVDKEAHSLAVLEGQSRPSLIRGGPFGLATRVVLLDCEPSVRSDRLRGERQQPHLDTTDMHRWAAYLRSQADLLALPIIDTTRLTPELVADELYALAKQPWTRADA